MERSWYWRLGAVLILVILGAYYTAPSVLYFLADSEVRRSREAIAELIPDFLPKSRLNLGIDLQGGVHLVMGVDTEKAVQDRADRVCEDIAEKMGKEGFKVGCKREGEGPVLTLSLNGAPWDEVKKNLKDWNQTWHVTRHSGDTATFAMLDAREQTVRDDAVDQALVTLRNRIDKYGVTEPEVRRRGSNSIMIQIAGLTAEDFEKIKEDIIGRTAQLEFKIVDDSSQFFAEIAKAADKPASVELSVDTYRGPGEALIERPFLRGSDKHELMDFLKKHPAPENRKVGIEEDKAPGSETVSYTTWLLDKKTPLTGDALTDAMVAFDQEQNGYYVNMRFDRRGAEVFEKLTRENTKRKMAIVLDDAVDSAPIINGPIPNGSAQITLGGGRSQQETLEEAKNLVVVLKAGALPAPVYPQEERTVGATLGDDAIQKGKLAMGFALLFISIMMVIYYRGTGFAGVIAVFVNMLLLFAALSAFGATLTLPGIAGLALTVGMAVDANIIQFERIRDELMLGKTARAAVDAGFDKAFSAIFDANATTAIASVVLLQYGSGPIQGFATTLLLGVIINTFTAVVVPRLILEYFTRGRRVEKLSI